MTRFGPTDARCFLAATAPHVELGYPAVADAEAGVVHAVSRHLRPGV